MGLGAEFSAGLSIARTPVIDIRKAAQRAAFQLAAIRLAENYFFSVAAFVSASGITWTLDFILA
jgi:hypothetical protein